MSCMTSFNSALRLPVPERVSSLSVLQSLSERSPASTRADIQRTVWVFYGYGQRRYGILYPSDTASVVWLSALFTPLISRSEWRKRVEISAG
jgi:hypothetical protein